MCLDLSGSSGKYNNESDNNDSSNIDRTHTYNNELGNLKKERD